MRPRPLAILTLAVVGILYVVDLAHTPVYLGGDEAHFAVIAKSIATTGANLRGDVMPVVVNLGDPLGEPSTQAWGDTWYQPMLFYITALVLKVLPFTETVVRLPAAVIGGLIAPLLLYLCALRIIGQPVGALVAALVLALAPAELILSRQALDYVCPLPFVIAWLWCLWSWMESRRDHQAVMIGLILGVGFYSYVASWMLMPIYLAMSMVVFLRHSPAPWRTILLASAGFLVPLSALLVWSAFHPAMLRDLMARYDVVDADSPSLLTTYASFFDPVLWFVRGGPSLTTSTGRAGVFLVPVAVLFPAGLYHLWTARASKDWFFVIVIGLLVSVVPAALKAEPLMIQRAMYLAVFVALICGFGADLLWRAERRLIRLAAIGLALLGVLQFGVFYRDYFTHYKLRSAFYYDPVAFVDVASYLLEQPNPPLFYFDTGLDDPAAKWRFYVTKQNRLDVLRRTRYFDHDALPIADAPAGALCVTYVERPVLDALTASGAWTVVQIIHDVDRREAAAILRKVREGL